jgi:hypothetical protein
VELSAVDVEFFEDERDPDSDEIFLSLSDVPNVQRLSLDDCVFTLFPTTFTHLKSLRLTHCRGFSAIPGFPSLDSLEVVGCYGLTELHLYGGEDGGEKYPICQVKIRECIRLQKLRISRKISQLKISGCPTLSRLAIESRFNFLKVRKCPKLRDISQAGTVYCSDLKLGREEDEDKDQEDESESDHEDEDLNKSSTRITRRILLTDSSASSASATYATAACSSNPSFLRENALKYQSILLSNSIL